MIRFKTIPMAIFACPYSALSVRMVVRVPAPAINGKAMGTIDVLVELASGSVLNISMPRIISAPMAKMIKAPAMAKSSTSIPKRLRIDFPTRRKVTIKTPATIVALPLWIWPTFFLRLITIGIDPKISITENKINVTDNISFRLNKVL